MRRKGMDPSFAWSANHIRAGKAIEQTVTEGLRNGNQCRALFFTFTLGEIPPGTSKFKHANKCLRAAAKRLLPGLFEHMVKVFDVDRQGKPHIHGVAFAKEDILEGFDPQAYDRYMEASANGAPLATLRRMRSEVSSNPALHRIWRALDERLENHGFGPLHGVFPIRDYPDFEANPRSRAKVAIYLARAYYKAVPAIRKSKGDKGVRAFSISAKFPSRKRAADMISPQWTAALDKMKKLFGFEHNHEFQALLGRKWALSISHLVSALDVFMGKNRFNQGWREFELGNGAWLSRVLHFMIEKDYFLYRCASRLLPDLDVLKQSYVPPFEEPRMIGWVPLIPMDRHQDRNPRSTQLLAANPPPLRGGLDLNFCRPPTSTPLTYL